VLLWPVYGILLHAMPVILAYGITQLVSASILALKIRDMLHRQRCLQAAD